MNKKLKVLLIGGIVLAVLIAALVTLLLLLDDGSGTSPSDSGQSSINLVENNINNITGIAVKNGSGSFVIEQPKDGVFAVDVLKDLPTDQSAAKSAASALAVIDAVRVVSEEPGDLDEYGLKDPKTSAKVTLKDGTTYTLNIGIRTPLNEGYYAMLEGDKKVYLVAIGLYRDLGDFAGKDYLNKTIAKLDDVEEAKDAVRKLTLERVDFDETLVFEMLENDPEGPYSPMYSSDFVMTSPVKAFIDGAEFEYVAEAVTDFKANAVVSIFPTESELSSYGFDDPQAVLTAEMTDGSEVQIIVGNDCYGNPTKDEESTTVTGSYLQLAGRDAVYYVESSRIPFRTDSMFSILSQIAFAPNITSLDTMTVTAEGVDYVFDFTQKTDEDSGKTSTSATINGKQVDDSRLSSFYMYLVSALANDLHPEPAEGDPILEIRFQFLDASVEPLTVRFYDLGERKALIEINGQARFETRLNYVTSFYENIKAVAANEDINPNY